MYNNDKADKTSIPTVNNGTLTIQRNGSNVTTFSANSSSNATANISVPTALSELTADSTHRLVTDTEKSRWNNKVSSSWNLLVHESVINGTRYEYNEDIGALGNNEYVLFALGHIILPPPMYIIPAIFNNPKTIDTINIISSTKDSEVNFEFYGESGDQVYFSCFNDSDTTVDFYVYYR